MIDKKSVYAGIIGGVVADALGVPYEFSSYQRMQDYPCTTIRGYGTYSQPPGTWSDDSSMTLATMDSLTNGINLEDMINKFCEWIFDNNYTPHGEVFDYGLTTESALRNYRYFNQPIEECGLRDERSNGNGSLMRIMPAILYSYAKKLPLEEEIKFIGDVSGLTHAHKISKASCNIYNFVIKEVLDNPEEDFNKLIIRGIDKSSKYYENDEYPCFEKLYNTLFLLNDDYIRSKGYVVDSLEVALYSCYHTNSYKEAVLKSINYGGDTDTNAIITGGLAALYYGFNSIPNEWVNKISRIDYIKELCDKFYDSLVK